MMNLRKLNSAGEQQFVAYLAALRSTASIPPPPELIDDPRFTEVIEPVTSIDRPTLESKYAAGGYLRDSLSGFPASTLRRDVGIWSWLAIYLFDELCPMDGRGHRKPKENAKYIASPGDHRYGLDKHFLFFPWKMVNLHGENAKPFLMDSLDQDTRAQREWTGYHLNVSTFVVKLGSQLYGDPDKGGLKRGATSTKRAGNLRRFVQVLKQLEVTYDIHGMSNDELEEIMPVREFENWME